MALADIVVVMNDGRIEQAATPREVFERPATAFVARFMGDHNVISGRYREKSGDLVTLEVAGGGTFVASGMAPDDGAVDIAVRTDRVRVGEAEQPGLGFTGIVSNVEYRGASVKIAVTGAGIEDFNVILSDAAFFENPVRTGDAIPLSWNAADAIVLGRVEKGPQK
jgi:putative spermidine/putrescine transport system ATP-binding protein